MENPKVWLIYHKATLSEVSPLNLDGSEWIEGICIVPANDVDTALQGYRALLKEDHMEEIELYKVVLYRAEDYANDDLVKHIEHSVRISTSSGDPTYVGTLTSEGSGL